MFQEMACKAEAERAPCSWLPFAYWPEAWRRLARPVVDVGLGMAGCLRVRLGGMAWSDWRRPQGKSAGQECAQHGAIAFVSVPRP